MLDSLGTIMGKLDPLLFQRSYELVTILSSKGNEQRADGAPVIRPVSADMLLPRVTERVDFVSIDYAKHTTTKRAPSKDLLRSFISSPDRWDPVRHLRGVSEAPIFRPDGSIFQTPGYDEQT